MGSQVRGGALPAYSDEGTSLDAARRIAGEAGTLRRRVWEAVRERGPLGLTCDEVERCLNMRHQTASARVNELMRKGALVDRGVRRRTSSGRSAVAWVAVELERPKGQAELFGRAR